MGSGCFDHNQAGSRKSVNGSTLKSLPLPVHISDYRDNVGLFRQHYIFKLLHDLRGLHCVRCRTYAQVNIRLWQAESAEERIGHEVVVMLADAYKKVLDPLSRHSGPPEPALTRSLCLLIAAMIGVTSMKFGRAPRL
jgi:hypothetical protein